MINIISKIKNLPNGVKASAAFFISSVVSMGISYITTPIFTRLLSPDEYGQFSVFSTWVNIFGIFAMFNLSASVFNIGMLDYPEKRDEYSYSMLILSNICTICFFVILLSVYPLIKTWVGLDLPLIILIGVLFLVQPAYNFWTARQRYELRYKWTLFWSILVAFISPVIAIICVFTFNDNKLYARIFGSNITLIVIYFGFYLFLTYKGNFHVKTKYWKSAILFNLPLLPHYLSGYLLGSSDKLMISNLIGDSKTAYYSVAYTVSSVVMIIWNAANASLVPYTYEKCEKKDYKSISTISMIILTVFGATCVAVIMFAPEVVAMVAAPEYKEAIYAIPPIVGGVFFQIHFGIYANILFYYKKPKYVTVATVVSTVLNFILNYIFIKRFGYIAAGYTTLICYLVQAILDYIVMRKIVGESIYNMKYLGGLSLMIIIVSLVSNFLYSYVIVRYIILTVILLLGAVFRKRIVRIFKIIKAR